MKQPLNEALKEYYSQELNERQVLELSTVSTFSFQSKLKWALTGGFSFLAIAIVLAIAINTTREPLILKIAKEVSYNHNKQIPSEIVSNDHTFISKFLDRLDFSIQKSKNLSERYVLVGGRYCSIQGHIAAQLKLQIEGTASSFTLFQFKAPDSFGLSDQVHTENVNGVEVKIWQEGPIGFALAKSLSE